MGQELFSPLLGITAMTGTILGFLIGWVVRRSRHAAEKQESERLMRSYQELSQDSITLQEELTRKREIASRIPMIVSSLSGRMPINAIPPIAVRFMKEFFHASQVGFFAQAKGEKSFTLIEGVGFPADWKGKIRLDPEAGILGMALHNNIVATRDDYLAVRGQFPAGIHSLEKNGVSADLVAPVSMDLSIVGALVVGSSTVRISEETPLASMIADLIGNAFQHATTIESVEQKASIDPLTKIFTRGHFIHLFEAEIRRARNYSHPLSLLLLDIDHFKKVNDTYGHPVGDIILTSLGEILTKDIRSSDFAARYGGEEFTVVMRPASKEQANTLANNLRQTVESTEFRIPGQENPLRVTISGGLATFPEDGTSTTELIQSADEALYEAKQTGRNRIVRAHQIGLDGSPVR